MASLGIARVVVACDAAGEVAPAIEAGMRLAAHWRAKLRVVFLEDPQLRLLAANPQARHVSLTGPAPEGDEASDIEHMFVAVAQRARAQLAEQAGRRRLDWSFAVISDAPSTAAVGVAENDLLVVEGTARPFAGQLRLRSRFSAMALEAALPVLIIRSRRRPHRIVVATFGPDSPGLRRTLAAAGDMAAAGGGSLLVLATAKAPSAAGIMDILAADGHLPEAGIRIEKIANASALHNAHGHHLKGALLVLDAAAQPPELGDLEQLATKADCDVMLVR